MSDQDEKTKPGLYAPREKEIGKGPHLWLQWKGTDVCADIHCACGAHLHFDGFFLYQLRCGSCGQAYECGTHVTLYPIEAPPEDEFVKLIEPDPEPGFEEEEPPPVH